MQNLDQAVQQNSALVEQSSAAPGCVRVVPRVTNDSKVPVARSDGPPETEIAADVILGGSFDFRR